MKDSDIRLLLRNTELLKFLSDGESRVVEEMKLPAAYARVDLAVINGHLHGFEIKSASDTLQRLPGQIEAYTKVFDYLYIITEGKYYNKILDTTPDWVGVYVCVEEKGLSFLRPIRAAQKNTKKEGFYIAKLLWREEILQLLNEHRILHKKKDRNWLLCEVLASSLEIETLSEAVRQKLKNRPNEWLLKLTATECYAEK